MSEGKVLSGQTLQDICRYWNSGEMSRRTLPITARSGHDRVLIWNKTGDFLIAGSVVKASDMIVSNPTYEDAFLGYLNHGICVQGVKPTKFDDVVAIIDDDVAPGYCVTGVIPGAFACLVNMYSQTDEYAEASVAEGCIALKSCSAGRYRIFAKSQALAPTNKRFCFLQLDGGGGGHRVGTTLGVVTAGTEQDVRVTVNGRNEKIVCTCPLLSGSATLASGTKVIISLNRDTKEWEIIEAACN